MFRKIIFFVVALLWVAMFVYVACDYNKEQLEGGDCYDTNRTSYFSR